MLVISALLLSIFVFRNQIDDWLWGKSPLTESQVVSLTAKQMDTITSDFADKIYDNISTNIDYLEPSSFNSIKSNIHSWLQLSLDSDILNLIALNSEKKILRIFISSGKPFSSEGESKGDLNFDRNIKDFGFQIQDGEWWLRLTLSNAIISYSDAKLGEGDSHSVRQAEQMLNRFIGARKFAIVTQDFITDTSILDPVSLEIGIERSIPYTYNASLEQSAIYLESLQLSGWAIDSIEAGELYLDFYLSNRDSKARAIVLEGSLKVFYWGTKK
ncbi:hypothetical protein [Paenibacillus sp. L3-i20]|uniref:hypothetical protein n=1 Tax=Paenibacillus sp. L3-i20 TaxID=2905833 RepID=UPI0020832002|nr:hypothetical protein [Paenibacillus sp. L3-i20]GKU77562.1 hypothetical protein L3i20_v219590 [Paenibacillus sp. L3-i20]